MKLLENKIIGKINYFSPIFKYVGIILTWISLIMEENIQNFLSIFEKKVGFEVLLLSVSFLLIGLGQNTQTKKRAINFNIYILLFSLFLIGSVIAVWDDTQLLISVLIIMITNLINFMSQSGEYGALANDIFMSGRGSVFYLVLAVIYGIPTGLLLKHLGLWENVFILGISVIVYYLILLLFELKFMLEAKV